jgi:hypothetical protein
MFGVESQPQAGPLLFECSRLSRVACLELFGQAILAGLEFVPTSFSCEPTSHARRQHATERAGDDANDRDCLPARGRRDHLRREDDDSVIR